MSDTLPETSSSKSVTSSDSDQKIKPEFEDEVMSSAMSVKSVESVSKDTIVPAPTVDSEENAKSVVLIKKMQDTEIEKQRFHELSSTVILEFTDPLQKRLKFEEVIKDTDVNKQKETMEDSVSCSSKQVKELSDSEQKELIKLRQQVQIKDKVVKDLLLIASHQEKQSLEELQGLVEKWKEVTIVAVEDLFQRKQRDSNNSEGLTMEAMLTHFNIDPSLMG